MTELLTNSPGSFFYESRCIDKISHPPIFMLISRIKASISGNHYMLTSLMSTSVLLVCDLFCCPDLAICDTTSIHILELAVCHEINVIASNDYKKNKNRNVYKCGSSVTANRKIVPHFIEISILLLALFLNVLILR